jgi:type III secretory pathway lipoprotein EscJ
MIRASLILLILLLTACQEVLVSDLSEVQAQRLCSVLAEERIDFDRKLNSSGEWTIYVDKSDFHGSLILLKQNHLLTSSLDSRPIEPSAFSTSLERKFHLQKQREMEIQQALEKIPGVLQARLLISPDPEAKNHVRANGHCGSLILFVNSHLTATTKQIRQIVAGATGLSRRCIKTVISRVNVERGKNLNLSNATFSNSEAPKLSFETTLKSLVGGVGLLSVLVGMYFILRVRIQGENVL